MAFEATERARARSLLDHLTEAGVDIRGGVDRELLSVELENERVRVLRIKYGPHEKSAMHDHPASVGIF